MSEKQTEAQRLADALAARYPLSNDVEAAASELRRLDSENEQLRAALLTLHDTMEMTARAGAAHARHAGQLEAQLEAVGAGGIGPLMKEIRDDAAKTSSIDSPMNACMYRAACKRWLDQAEQQAEPVAWINWCAATGQRSLGWQCESELASEPLYHAPQPAQQPLSSARIDELIQEGVFGCNPYELVRRLEEERGVFKTKPLTDEQILEKVAYATRAERSMFLRFARAIERAHNIK